MIYFDNAATSFPKPQAVFDAVNEAMRNAGNPSRGAHALARWAARSVDRVREQVADLMHAPDSLRIGFTSNITHSLNLAIHGLLQHGDHVITTVMEHNSVLRPLYLQGVETAMIGFDEQTGLHYHELEQSIQPNTKAVICTHASNVTGDVVDIERISAFCRRHGLLLIVDAAQTAGVFEIDVVSWAVDVLCFTGHKSLFGPQGTGGIYIREDLELAPYMVGGSGSESFNPLHPRHMPDAVEAGTQNCHGIAGLGAGIAYIKQTGIDEIRAKEQRLAERFESGISPLEHVHIYRHSPPGRRAPVVSLTLGDADPALVSGMLAERYQIATRAGAHCAPLMHKALGTGECGAVRFSFSCFNTEVEVDTAIEAMWDLSKLI